ncbi:uncharacterized protein [Arachis hypogaea]|uniref:uncharacterized protein isoform X2 n=2 Tax=Arachis hypogaea TaxID=3818 RepID=UPI003B2262A4
MSDLSAEKISNIEADCYWCLSKLLDGMQDHYTFAQPGIQRLVFKLKELVRRIDVKLLNRARACFKPHGASRTRISSVCFLLIQLPSNPRDTLPTCHTSLGHVSSRRRRLTRFPCVYICQFSSNGTIYLYNNNMSPFLCCY